MAFRSEPELAPQCSSENNGSQAPLPATGLKQKFDRRKAQQIDIDGRNVLNGDRGSLLESPFVNKAKELWGRFIYTYFNWRKDAWADVQLLLFLNGGVVLLAGLAKRVLIDGMEPDVPGLWNDVYEVLTTWFGDFPEAESISRQVFSVSVAIIGLAAFAIVLALVEQIVLQILTENVSRGSVVYEKGHILVLAWANTQRDREVIWKILSQLCLAYRTDGGRVIVVLSGVLKTEMEETFRVIIPESERYGSTFVFRQGNPLLPDDLRTVAASAAAATVIVSDTSRGPGEADSQSLRAAVLLDELDFPGAGKPDPRRGYIVVGLQTQEATGLLKYSCSERVIPVPTNNLNARRISRNIQYPVLTYVSQMLLNFRSRAQGYLMSFQTIQGMRFGELYRVFPDAIVLGVSDKVTGKTKLNPPADFQIGPDESLVLMRPTTISETDYRPLRTPLDVEIGDWNPDGYVMRSRDEQPVRVRGSSSMDETSCSSAITGQPLVIKGPRKKKGGPSQAAGCYILPMEYSATSEDPVNVLVCGWGDSTFMISLLHSMDAELPRNSQITLLNLQRKEDVLGVAREAAQMSRVSCIHVYGDPLKYRDLELKLEVQRFNSAIVLCDAAWVDPDQNAANGIALRTKDDMLRLDSMVMSVQLSIRKLLEERGFPDINIITEKVAFQGITRFEDRGRMPLGSVFNITSFSARILSQAIYNPKAVMAYSEFGKDTEMMVQDSSSFAHEGEEVSFLQLQARAMEVSQVLVGFYDIPKSVEQPLQLVINPEGVEARTRKVVWNRNDNRVKLICLCKKTPSVDVTMPPSPVTETVPGDGAGEVAATQSMW
ncbi:g10394 [Coccomyxa elongata]